MFKAVSIGVFAVSSVFALTGCQLFDSHRLAKASEQTIEGRPGGTVNRGLAIDEGRNHLRANRNGMAIDAFNRGLAQGEDPAAAYNGLGVAYARIGRADLGYRYFKKAAMSNPDNPVYWRNLALLIDTPEFQLAANAWSRTDASAAAGVTGDASLPAPARAQGTQLVRNGSHQFDLVTVPNDTPASNSVSSFAMLNCDTGATGRPCRQRVLKPVRSRLTATAPELSPSAAKVESGKRKTIDLSRVQSDTAGVADKPEPTAKSDGPV